MMVRDEFNQFFVEYVKNHGKASLTYVISSDDRPTDPLWSPHRLPGNAMDITLRTNKQYSVIEKYNELFLALMKYWPFRAGIDNTHGNIHIHLDLGLVKPEDQDLPFFFKENDGKFQWQIKTADDLYKI